MNSKDTEKYNAQAMMLANRVSKRYKHLKKGFAKQNIDVFRLYDWDIPEIRVVVDWYAGHLVIAEYTRMQSIPGWLKIMGSHVAELMGVPSEKIHYKERRAGYQDGKRYERIDFTNEKIVMAERDLNFYVNPNDYVDTGLFSDHRNTRMMVRELSEGKNFLNLYCYTGAFTCYAAKGGAGLTTSVDRSGTAISWLRENLTLNGISTENNLALALPVLVFLERAKRKDIRYDLAVIDPPSFSTSRDNEKDFDIVKDHPMLLRRSAELMNSGAIIFFSTNHQDFVSRLNQLNFTEVNEITSATIPDDYLSKQKKIHRCWKIIV